MTVYEAATTRRTIRKFGPKPIGREHLERYVNAARLAPSAANMQALKYVIVDAPTLVDNTFEKVKWAAYIAPEGTPKAEERPTAFIVILADTEIRSSGYELDAGAAAQNIMLCAWEDGVGACWMGAIDRPGIQERLGISHRYTINTIIALGRKAESPITEVLNDSVKYWKDAEGQLHIPKRSLDEVIVIPRDNE